MLRLASRAHPPRLCPKSNAATSLRRALSTKKQSPPPEEWKPLRDNSSEPLSWRFKLVSAVTMGGALAFFAYVVTKPKDKFSGRPTVPDLPMMPHHFIETVVLSSTETGPDSKLITIAVPPRLLPPLEPTDIITDQQAKYTKDVTGSPIWSLYVKNPDIQIERPYTPLEGINMVDGRMSFWVKKYKDGEMGRWLCGREFGDKVEIRGPVKTWPWQEEQWDEVIMVTCPIFEQTRAGLTVAFGTGIRWDWCNAVLPASTSYSIFTHSFDGRRHIAEAPALYPAPCILVSLCPPSAHIDESASKACT
jgi:hypothetical protein